MQTLTITIDDSYLNQVLRFLKSIPKSKRHIVYAPDTDSINPRPNKDLLRLLKNGPVLTGDEIREWENDLKDGYRTWTIEAL